MVGVRDGRTASNELEVGEIPELLGVGLIFGATLLAYLPAVTGGFLWDDDGHVTRADLQSFDGLGRIWFELGATQQYYPLLHTAFWLEHRLWGDAVVGYHLLNILLHATAACLVGLVLRRVFALDRDGGPAGPTAGRAGPATGRAYNGPDSNSATPWFAAMIFALHPVCVESVAWISEQKNTLSAVFYLASALVYLGFDRDRRPAQYGVALGLFVLALLTKTVTATLPAALLVVFWWSRGRLSWTRDARPLLPWFALGGTAGLFSAWVERALIGAHGADFSLTLLERGLLAGRVMWFYLGKLVWPTDLVFIYPRWVVDSSAWWQYLFPLGVLAVVAGLGLTARRHRGPLGRAATAGLAGFLIFAGTLFPALGFVNVYPFIFSYVADHFQYLASLGIVVPVSAGLALAAGRIPPAFRKLIPAGAGVLLAALGVLTWRQSGLYRDAQTLYRATLALNPACAMAHNNLGLVLSQIPGRLPDAIAEYEAALRSEPRNLEAHLNLGYALAKVPGRITDAITEDETAVRLAPNMADAHDNLGVALSLVPGRMPEAVAQFEAAVRLNPGSAEMRDHLGSALIGIPGRLPEAIDHLETAVRITPGSAKAQNDLGLALAKVPGRTPEAVGHFEAALRIDPGSAEAHDNLGKVLLRDPGRLPEAIDQLEAAVRLDPGSADRHGALGSALLKDPRRLPEAIIEFEAVVRINPGLADGHYVLGMLLASQPGRRQEALAQFAAALRIKPDFEAAREGMEQLRAMAPH